MSNETEAVPNSLQDFTRCPDWGKGGRFTFDPTTGKRTRVAEEGEQPVVADQVVDTAAQVEELQAVEAAPSKKEKARG